MKENKPKSVDECWMIETSIKNDVWRPNTPSPNKEALLAYRKQAFTPSQVLRTRIRKWRAEKVCEWISYESTPGNTYFAIKCNGRCMPEKITKNFIGCPYCMGKIKVIK